MEENFNPQSGKAKKRNWVVILAVIVVVVLAGYYLWQNGYLLGGVTGYQAVFLSNGQVYFGNASAINSNYVNLRDVYYLQVRQVLQPVQEGQDPVQQQQISLAKLGVTELHRPKDLMRINRDHILFIEDLEDESQVVQAIDAFKASQDGASGDSDDEG